MQWMRVPVSRCGHFTSPALASIALLVPLTGELHAQGKQDIRLLIARHGASGGDIGKLENAPAKVAENDRAPVRHMQNRRYVRPFQNALAEIRPGQNLGKKARRKQNARYRCRPCKMPEHRTSLCKMVRHHRSRRALQPALPPYP